MFYPFVRIRALQLWEALLRIKCNCDGNRCYASSSLLVKYIWRIVDNQYWEKREFSHSYSVLHQTQKERKREMKWERYRNKEKKLKRERDNWGLREMKKRWKRLIRKIVPALIWVTTGGTLISLSDQPFHLFLISLNSQLSLSLFSFFSLSLYLSLISFLFFSAFASDEAQSNCVKIHVFLNTGCL